VDVSEKHPQCARGQQPDGVASSLGAYRLAHDTGSTNLRRNAMNDYDPDDYEYQQLLAERRHARQNNKYYAQNDPEAPDDSDEESSDD
jgi:hypothetical protein